MELLLPYTGKDELLFKRKTHTQKNQQSVEKNHKQQEENNTKNIFFVNARQLQVSGLFCGFIWFLFFCCC